jgi:hypothetical protein
MSHLLRRIGLTALVALCSAAPAFARSVWIEWDANKEPDIVAYVVRYGTASGEYKVAIDVGNRTKFALALDEFTTYYVAVEAYNTNGLHSALSSEITIPGDHSTCSFSLNPPSASVGSEATILTVGLTTQPDCPWNVASSSSWITVNKRTATKGSGSVSLAIAANSGGMPRVGTVVIGGRTLSVTQDSEPGSQSCAVSATPNEFGVFSKDGGSGRITVAASGTGCAWTLSSDANWLTFTGSASRTGVGTVAFDVAANTGVAREGHLTVAGTRITITQQPGKRIEALDFDGRGADAFLYDKRSGDWIQYSWHGTFMPTNDGVSSPGMTVLPADFNRDGRSDLFTYNARTGVWGRGIADEDGSIQLVESNWQNGWVPTIADFNGDGRSDVFFYQSRSGRWVQWITEPTTLAISQRSGRFEPGWTVYRAVFNRDGRDDLFLYNANPKTTDRNAGKWARALTQADLSFVVRPGRTRWSDSAAIVPADFTGNGLSDVFSLTRRGRWQVATFTAGGVTVNGGQWAAGWSARRGEFNGDGVTDLFLYNPTNGQFRVVLRKGTEFTVLRGTWGRKLSFDLTDLNGDGLSDIVSYDPRTGVWATAITTARGRSFVFAGGTFDRTLTLLAGHSRRP